MRRCHPLTKRIIFIAFSFIVVLSQAEENTHIQKHHPQKYYIRTLGDSSVHLTSTPRPLLSVGHSLIAINHIRAGGGDDDDDDDESKEEKEVKGDEEDEGSSETVVKARKKKAKRKKRRSNSNSAVDDAGDTDGRRAFNAAMRKKDSAELMGDAIRSRKKEFLQDDLKLRHPRSSYDAAESSLSSLRYALGSSDTTSSTQGETATDHHDDEGGGVEVSTSAVIANYFLKSHGGAHPIQSVASFLSVITGISSFLLLPSSASLNKETIDKSINLRLQLVLSLLRRTLLCALTKHLSGFIAVASMSASKLPDVGWRETRRNLEGLVLDPVVQYLFYCALLFIWSSGSTIVGTPTTGKTGVAATTGAVFQPPWWLISKYNKVVIACVVGPVLIREFISTIWVVSDVLVLLYSTGSRSTYGSPKILSLGRATTDAIMSLLLKPETWREADAPTRQRLLAQLVSRTSLVLELGMGLILIFDSILAYGAFAIKGLSSKSRTNAWDVAKRIACTRFYLNFLFVRRKKIEDLVGRIRGGARHVPGRILDVLLEPVNSMGLHWDDHTTMHDDVTGRRSGNLNDEEGMKKGNRKKKLQELLFLLGF